MANEESDVFIELYGPDGEQASNKAVIMNSDGSFSTSFDLNDQINNGTYTAVASYAGANDEITFEVGAKQVIHPEVAIVTGATLVAGGGGGVLLYKQGYLKGGKHVIKKTQEEPVNHSETKIDNLPIIELRIECGLENFDVIERETSNKENMIIGELTEIEQKFSQAINRILENREKLKNIQKQVEFIEWCQEAKEDPDKILSKISNDVIGKFLGSIEPYFQNLMLSKISVESDISVTKDSPKRIKKNITFSLKPIRAYIALVVYSNGVRVSSTKFIFAINSYVKIKNLAVYLAKVNKYQDKLEQQVQQVPPYRIKKVSNSSNELGRRIKVENLLIGISVQLTKMKIGNLEKTIEPPLDIGKKEAEIESILFFS
jgi:hypothetical protein